MGSGNPENPKYGYNSSHEMHPYFGIWRIPGVHGSHRTRVPTYFSGNLRVPSRKQRGGSPKYPISRLGGILCLKCIRMRAELHPYFTKARKSSSWCVCETTAPRLFMSTPRTSTPPILVLQLCCDGQIRGTTSLTVECVVSVHVATMNAASKLGEEK